MESGYYNCGTTTPLHSPDLDFIYLCKGCTDITTRDTPAGGVTFTLPFLHPIISHFLLFYVVLTRLPFGGDFGVQKGHRSIIC